MRESSRREAGVALIVTTLVLLLIGMIAMTALEDSEREATAGARSRANSRTLYAADAGIQLAMVRLSKSPPDLTAFDVNLADGANVQSRTRSAGSPTDIGQVGLGATPDGCDLSVDANCLPRIYQVNVTASYANSATAELEAKVSRTGGASEGNATY